MRKKMSSEQFKKMTDEMDEFKKADDDTPASVGVTYYYYVTASNSYRTSGFSAYDTGYQ
jgi:hypothetical protein